MKFPRSSNGLYNISSVPSINSEQYSIVINDFYIIAIPKNNAAKKHFGKWSKECSKVKDNSQLPHLIANLEELITDKSKFVLIDDQEQAYREYIKISWDNWYKIPGEYPKPHFPEIPFERYLDLLIEWFENYLTLKVNKLWDKSPTIITKCKELVIEDTLKRMRELSKYGTEPHEFAVSRAFIDWLKEQLAGIVMNEKTTQKPELSLAQIALICFYKGQRITRKNGNSIARKYGHHSGERLFQLYSKYSSTANRTGQETTRIKNLNKLALFEAVIPKLSVKAKQRATDEMNTLKAAFESENK